MEECRNCKNWEKIGNAVGTCVFLKTTLMQKNTFPNKEIHKIHVYTHSDFWCNNFKIIANKIDMQQFTNGTIRNN